ncbi:MAG: methylenetetrahydrofolate--tRNA-(uracil(54)-C(5))-methyltransferase (FADH(2)-oxidizing) TrmFO [Clostridia bacterium]|nr:methylenetetrahydrofolate--tRNA-(uracil(54)-C(5))-methyltransferase (FADH(2)-oxidizing) TrmFO [Clostridia bacterium]
MKKAVKIIGAGLAGCEAALTLSKRGLVVTLIDCKPREMSPAHSSNDFAEVVCSNSFKSSEIATASGLLKAEMDILGCSLLEIARTCSVPAGGALAVDRQLFSQRVTERINSDENIKVVCQTVDDWDDEPTIIATGPLTLGGLNDALNKKLCDSLHFYDAEAPIISGDSIDYLATFGGSRYGRGGDDYINCPMNREEYYEFVEALVTAERALGHEFDKREIFEGCMPVEVMASRGKDTLRFGPLRPVGFLSEGKRPFAVVQLRRENTTGDMYNIVGFQTNLKFSEQKRVFGIIPALKNAEYLRYGVMHRNSYVDAPKVMNSYLQLKDYQNVFIAGQLSGVEGYVESIAMGLISAHNIANFMENKPMLEFPDCTILGALLRYLATPNSNFQPMNANFGLLPPVTGIKDKMQKKIYYSNRSLDALKKVDLLF